MTFDNLMPKNEMLSALFQTLPGQIVPYLNELTNNSKASISQVANQAQETLTKTSQEAVHNVNNVTNTLKQTASITRQQLTDTTKHLQEIATNTQQTLTATTTNTTQKLHEATSQFSNEINTVTTTAKTSLEQTIKSAENLTHSISGNIQNAFDLWISTWLQKHPRIDWSLEHPLLSFFIILLAMLVLWTLLQAIASGLHYLGKCILKSPWVLGKSLWGLGTKTWTRSTPTDTLKGDVVVNVTNDQIQQILRQLELIHQQQQSLCQELALLQQKS